MIRTREPLPTHVRGLAPLPEGYREALDQGLEALRLELSGSQRTAIDDHLRLLLAWTVGINLTAIRDPVAAATLHVLDSLAAVPLIRSLGAERLVDIGAGGGYPGLPLAIAVPAQALLVESVAKKARFLETAVAVTRCDGQVGVAAARAEVIARDEAQRGRWPLVTARAVADLAELIELGLPLLVSGGALVAWKRERKDELDAGRRAAVALGGTVPEVHRVDLPGLETHRLIVVRKARPTPAAFPRDPALRSRRPL
jgi:16S rRNA (guanine527-N7)-methyltransferase